MSILQKYLNGIRSGSSDDLYRGLSALDSYLDQINASTGGVQNNKVDDPGNASRPVAVPPLVKFTVKGSTGSFLLSILNPQSINALTPNQRKQQVAGGVNAPATMLYHQLQSATELSFSANVHLVDHGMSPQTSYSIPDTGNIKYFRVRSSYDQKSWNQWQAVEAGDSGASGLNLQTNGNENGTQQKLNLIGDVTEDGNGNVLIASAQGLPLPWNKNCALWQPIPDNTSVSGFSSIGDMPNFALVNGGTFAPYRPSEIDGVVFRATFLQSQGMRLEGRSVIATARKSVFETIVSAIQGCSQANIWVGLYGGIPWGMPLFDQTTCVGKGNLASFRYRASEATSWQCCVGTTNAMTKVTTGVNLTTARQKLRIELDGAQATFYIDGQLVATISDNYPANTGLGLHIGYWLFGAGANGDGLAVRYLYGESVMP